MIMKLLFIVLKVFINLILASFYVLISIIFWNFVYWLVLSILGKQVPGPQDPIHVKLAVLSVFLSLIFSLLLRKYLYLSVISLFRDFVLKTENLQKKEKKINSNNEKTIDKDSSWDDELKIYVNKEIK